MSYSLTDIANEIGAKLVLVKETKQCLITGLATLASAQEGHVAFLSNSKYQQQLAETKASAVIVSAEMAEHCPVNALVMDNPYMGYAILANLLNSTPKTASGIHGIGTNIDILT